MLGRRIDGGAGAVRHAGRIDDYQSDWQVLLDRKTDHIVAKMGRRPARCYRYCKNKPYVYALRIGRSIRQPVAILWVFEAGQQWTCTEIGWRFALAATRALQAHSQHRVSQLTTIQVPQVAVQPWCPRRQDQNLRSRPQARIRRRLPLLLPLGL